MSIERWRARCIAPAPVYNPLVDSADLSPNFVIPIGTQVVLKKDLDVLGAAPDARPGHAFKKAGSVGVIVSAPPTNDQPYVVRFADGRIVQALQRELAVRRSYAPHHDLPPREVEEYERHLIYRIRVGSKAFGLADENSDDDERGIYLAPAEWHWSLRPLPEQIEFKRTSDGRILHHNQPEGDTDVCWWELGKFLTLALKANPNILEALFTPREHVLFSTPLAEELRALRDAFLSKYLFQTYSGYVLSQFRKMRKDLEGGGSFKRKHAMHLIRLLRSGIEALRGNGIVVDARPWRDELLAIKYGKVPFETIHARALELHREFEREFTHTTLPDRPDVDRVDRFCIEARRRKAYDADRH